MIGRGTAPGPIRRAVALIALALGLAGFVISAAGLATQLLPRQFTAAQQQQIKNWEIASRWQQLAAGRIFPASVRYQLPAYVAPGRDVAEPGRAADRHRAAVRLRRGHHHLGRGRGAAPRGVPGGPARHLRGRHLELRHDRRRGRAPQRRGGGPRPSQSLSQPRLTAARSAGAGRLDAGILVVRYHGTAAAMYDYSRQISASFAKGPYLVMYAAGYADSRPRVPVASDRYSDTEMTFLAQGVARSVADTLAAQPASPHCPGAPGC